MQPCYSEPPLLRRSSRASSHSFCGVALPTLSKLDDQLGNGRYQWIFAIDQLELGQRRLIKLATSSGPNAPG